MDKLNGLLGNPLFMMGLGGLANRGQASGMMQGLLGAGQFQQQQANDAYKKAQLEQWQAKNAREVAEDKRQQQIRERQEAWMTENMPNYAYAPDAVIKAQLAQKYAKPSETTYGLTPVWSKDENGNPVLLQMNNRGGVKRVDVPQGLTPTRPLVKYDRGDSIQFADPITGEVVAKDDKKLAPNEEPQYKAEVAGAQVTGKSAAESQGRLPSYRQSVETFIDKIRQLKSHKGLSRIVGAYGTLPNFPGSDAASAEALANQVEGKVFLEAYEGKVFLEAYESLKGAGSITQAEAAPAAAAKARLDRAQSRRDYIIALNELESETLKLLELAEKKAGSGGIKFMGFE